MRKLVITTLVLAATTQVFAAKVVKKYDANYLTVRSVEYKDLTEQYRLAAPTKMIATKSAVSASGSWLGGLNTANAAVDKAALIVDKIVNIGEKIWSVVEKGRPVQNFHNTVANALPANASTWTDLISWKQPETKVIGMSYKNAYGIEVVRFVYRIILLSGGSVNGVGNYIGYAAVEPVELTTAFMYTFNSEAVVVNIFNKGTNENPLAGMILTVRWSVETVVKKSAGSHTFFMDGVGHIDAAEKATLK